MTGRHVRHRRLPALASLLAALLAGCAGLTPPPPPPEGLVFPRHTIGVGDAVEGEVFEATLRRMGECLWVEIASSDVMASTAVIWPPGWSARHLGPDDDRIAVIDEGGRLVVVEDERLTAGGLYVTEDDPRLEPGTLADANRCAGGSWFLVLDAESAGGG